MNNRLLSSFIQISLDGYYCNSEGDISFAQKPPEDEEWTEFVNGNASGDGILLFGRTTYEMMASWWPTPAAAKAMPVVAAAMNARPKVVFSHTMKSAEWANTRVERNAVEVVRRMKSEEGPGMAILGSGGLVAQLADAGLVDLYQVVIIPVALGNGKAFLAGLNRPLDLVQTKTRTFANGSVALWYVPRDRLK